MSVLQSLTCLLSAGLIAFITSNANGQRCYQVTDLRDLGFVPDKDDVFGINNHGEVAFAAYVDDDRHAFVWLPQANYGLDSGLHDLHPQGAATSAAHEISNNGYVVGQVNGSGFAWRLANPVELLDLGDPTKFPPPPNIEVSPKVAYGVSDDSIPVAFGDADGEAQCHCPPDGLKQDTGIGFAVPLQLGSTVLNIDPWKSVPDDCDQAARTRDGNTLGQIVGYSQKADLPLCINEGVICEAAQDATSWESGAIQLHDLGPESEGRGNNDSNQIVGIAWEPGNPCKARAFFWASATSPPFNLGNLAAVQAFQTSAEAINEPGPTGQIQVVGNNESTARGLLWTKDTGSDWEVIELSDHLIRCSTHWEILSADDVNDGGQIVAVADTPPGGGVQAHAVLLTPVDICPQCDSDLNGDDVVNVQDFLHLLGDWGDCPPEPTVWCRSDINCDGVANVADFLVMLAEWGPCRAPRGGPLQTVQDCIDKLGFEDPELLAACICAVEPEECDEE